jgi:hypothetical protein
VHLAPSITFYDNRLLLKGSKAYTYIIFRAAHLGAHTSAAGTTDGTTNEAYGKLHKTSDVMLSATVATVCALACTHIRYDELTALCVLPSQKLLAC